MGLQIEMGLPAVAPNRVQRALHRVAATRIGTAGFALVMAPADRLVHRLSGGRTTLGRSVGALPVVMLHTIGARSGEPRVTPINVVPIDGDLALIGSNYGKGRSPAWAHNLLANPEASLTYGDETHAVMVRRAEPIEYEAVFASAMEVYPGYAGYRSRATNEIPVFILTSEGTS